MLIRRREGERDQVDSKEEDSRRSGGMLLRSYRLAYM